MQTICSREIFTKKCRQQQNFDSDPKEAWHYNHVTFTPIAKNFMLYCRLIYMLSMLYVGLTIKLKVGIPESFKVGWYPLKITGSRHLKRTKLWSAFIIGIMSSSSSFPSSPPPPRAFFFFLPCPPYNTKRSLCGGEIYSPQKRERVSGKLFPLMKDLWSRVWQTRQVFIYTQL